MKEKLLLFCLALAALLSCNKEGEILYDPGGREAAEQVLTRSSVPADPYKLEVMQSALDHITASSPGIGDITLQPTDYYVRFLPADTAQIHLLQQLPIELFTHPLDTGEVPEYTTTEQDNFDPETDAEIFVPHWLYTVVPVGFVFPEGIEYETIYPVFIQRQNTLASKSQQLPDGLWKQVRDRALVQTGNVEFTSAESAEECQPIP